MKKSILRKKRAYIRRKRLIKAHMQRYHINPMRPKDTISLPKGNDWIFQPKYDGTRTIMITESNDTKIINRRFVDKSRLYNELNNIHKEIGSGHVLDGEVVNITSKEPYGSFEGLSHRDRLKESNPEAVKINPLSYVVFDALKIEGKDIRNKPLKERDELMRKTVSKSKIIIPIKNYKESPVSELRKNHAEGLVAKNLESKYYEGKTSNDWRKFKFTKEADVKVMGFTPGTGKRQGLFGAMKVGVKKHGRIVEVADVGTGFSDQQLRDIKKSPPEYARIRYRRIGSAGKFVEPRFIGSRDDITDKDTHI
jgi:bifunctional non-homologous end joining protein LigD